MIIAWIADYFVEEHQGGAQQTNEEMIRYGESLGYKIIKIRPDDFSKKVLKNVDLAITNNIMKFHSDYIEWISDNVPFIRYEHDYSCLDNHKNPFRNAVASIFLSPLHYKSIGIECPNVKYVPSPVIGFEPIKNVYRKKNSVIWIGYFSKHKGLDRIVDFALNNLNYNIDFYGNHDHEVIVELNKYRNLRYMGFLNGIKAKKKAYSSYEYFIHLPNWNEPFGRTILEAYLCGCGLIVDNDRIGAMSYGWDYSNYDMIKKETENAPAKFWEIVKECYGSKKV